MPRAKHKKAGKTTRVGSVTGFGTSQHKRELGRPITLEIPERIDASPERIAEVVLQAKPKKDWRYLKDATDDSR